MSNKQHTPGPEARTTNLIADATEVLLETGLTPRQLADQRAELLEALEELKTSAMTHRKKSDSQAANFRFNDVMKRATSAIAKARGEA